MTLWSDPLVYIFYPNPANASYDSPKALALLIICGLLVLVSFALRFWRRRLTNPVTKKLSRSWSSAAFWFGLIGLILVVSRVETISYVSMRLWWGVWLLSLLFYLFIQVRLFRARHYQILPKAAAASDERSKYLPHAKRK